MKELKTLRRDRGLTQVDLATKLGVAQSTIAMWECGAALPVASKLPDIADALSCSIDAIFGRDGPGQTST